MVSCKQNKIRFACEIVLCVLTVALAIVFIVNVADIYYSAEGDVVYSREIVWNRLKYLIAPLAIWVAGVVACFVLSVVYPTTPVKKSVSVVEKVTKLRKLAKRDCADTPYLALRKQYNTLEIWRYVMYGAVSAFALGVAIFAIVYISQKSNFSSGVINTDVLNMVKNIFPWIGASFVLFVAAVLCEHFFAKAELGHITKIMVMCKGMPIEQSPLKDFWNKVQSATEKHSKTIIWCVRGVVFAVAVTFVVLGIFNGSASDVLYKAINICTECIGLG